ncbi:MAG: hypothetical protein BA870_12585 [Desulfuromonadales bacterium C00003094]|jgi:all-trans-retinol 13,14-reductase|nr:MAG: hypothetical protein BA870_12585 [Desulfuromonadales bacterium C00003094]
MIYDQVVVGSGISGLVAATILAQYGHRVALIEQAPVLAPVLRGFSRQGIYYDTGFHYSGGLGDGEVLDVLFRYLGIAEKLEKYSFAADRFDTFRDVETQEEFHFPIGREALRDRLCTAFPQEREGIDKYLAMVQEACQAIPYLNLDLEFGQVKPLLGVHGPSLGEVLDRLIGNAALKGLLSMHSLLYGVPPDQVPFFLHASVAGLYYESVHGLKGGGLSLVQAFEQRLDELGVDVFLGQAAQKFSFATNGTLAGVTMADGEVVACRNCVATVHPQVFLDLVPPELLRPVYRRRLETLEETVSAIMLYAACEIPSQLLQGTNLFLGRLGQPLKGLGGGALEERPIYMAGTAPDEKGLGARGFVAICPAEQDCTARWSDSRWGKRPAEYLRFKEATMERMQCHIERSCPELRGTFKVATGATPLTIRDFAANPAGGLYGVKHRVGQYNPMARTRVPGLFLAGQAVVAPGVLGGALSGFLTCGQMLGQDQLLEGVKACS